VCVLLLCVLGGEGKSSLSPCQRASKAASKPGAFKPKCNADGTYAKIQCQASTGYCWCSNIFGARIGGTLARGKPACASAKGYPTSCEMRLNYASRSKAKHVSKPNCNADGSYAKIQCNKYYGYCYCSTKTGAEISGTRAAGKPACLNGKPTSCERKLNYASRSKAINVFKPNCNADGSYAKIQCYKYYGYCYCATKTGAQISGTRAAGKPACVNGKPTSCERKLNYASLSKAKNVYKPKCNADGSYAKLQCNGSYCWCSKKNGARIGGMIRKPAKPKC